MTLQLENLKPQEVFKYFSDISQIPRGSGNEKQISDYLVSEGKRLGLEVVQDEFFNVLIKKPATKGYENSPTVIIQGHMDMVCEKNKETEHDFEKDTIKLRVDGDFLYATDTTLGADNGIAVAMGLAILASTDIAHPALEVIFTADEEESMNGAMNLNGDLFKGTYIINIDSEEEGTITVSCAGGVTALVTVQKEFKDVNSNKYFEVLYNYTKNPLYKPSFNNCFKRVYSYAISLVDKMEVYANTSHFKFKVLIISPFLSYVSN